MKPRISLSICILLLATQACGLGPASAASTPSAITNRDAAAVATQVALQLTAAAPGTLTAPDDSATSPNLPAGSLLLVYSQAGNLRLWDGSAPRQLTASGQDAAPRFSDDGSVIAFRRQRDLWAINVDGSGERLLVSGAFLAALPNAAGGPLEPGLFAFAPRSHALYFNTSLADGSSSVPQGDLLSVDADNPAPQVLLNTGQGGAGFSFSPDGGRIALARSDRINMVNLDGSGLKTVFSFPPVNMGSGSSYIPQVVWTPDSTGFETVIPPADGLANPAAPSRFMFVPADGSRAAQLAEFIAAPASADAPRISPDGARVLYVRPQGASLELHIIDASTADRAYFSYAADKFGTLGWAPDSLHMLYWIDDRRRAYLGSSEAQAIPVSDLAFAEQVTWLDTTHCLFLDGAELRLRNLGQPSLRIDTADPGGFDFALPH